MLVESNLLASGWYEPSDITVSQAVDLLTRVPDWENGDGHMARNGFFYKPDISRCVVFGDGKARLIRTPVPKKLAVAMLSANGGEWQIRDELDRYSRPQLNYGRIWSLTVFVLLSLLPFVAVHKRKRKVAAI